MTSPHRTVLLQEAVSALVQDKSGIYVDATFGRGGHTGAILELLNDDGRVIALDKDPQAIDFAHRTIRTDSRLSVLHSSFSDLGVILKEQDLYGRVNGILLDLGVSSPQLDQADRGFSFLNDGPLDMRMDTTVSPTAAEWLADATVDEMSRVFRDYGEERFAKRIAVAISEKRQTEPLVTTRQLAELVAEASPVHDRHKHPATRVFQALRIKVNRELDELEQLFAGVVDMLATHGRLVVISFHSLEDRIVKHFLRDQSRGEVLPRKLPVTGVSQGRMKMIGKAVKPSREEVEGNPRARSAIMRTGEKR
jgi:16S rRNA (cytosine1402-N4)-methyltransferase